MIELTENVINKGDAHTQAEAALCVWEYALSQAGEEKSMFKGVASRGALYDWLCDGEGAAVARDNCIEIAHFVEHAYKVANDNDAMTNWCFDWDVVPVIMQAFRGRVKSPSDITTEIAIEVGGITRMTMEGCNDTH